MIKRRGKLYITISVAAFAMIAMLTSCGFNEETRNMIDQQAQHAEQELASAQAPNPNAKRYDPLVVTDKIWGGNEALRMQRGMPLPAKYETTQGVTLISAEPMSLSDIATAITSQTGIPVRVIENTLRAGGNANNAANNAPTTMVVSYEGPLSGLMEKIAGNFDVNWHYDGTTIDVSRYETRVFMIEALPETITTQDSSQGSSTAGSMTSGAGGAGGMPGGSVGGAVGGLGGSATTSAGSSTGALTQNTNYAGSIKYWDELKETLTAMVGGSGSVITSPSLGEVTVTTTGDIMRQVADYIAQENKRISRQIAINVEIFNVSLGEDQDFNVSFTSVLKQLSNIVNVNYTGTLAPASAGGLSNLGSLSIAILNPNNRGYANPADFIFNALSSVGDTTQVAQFPMTTLNNRAVTRFVGTSTNYVQNIQAFATIGTATTNSESVQTGQANSGFTIQLTPRLLDDGRIVMQYSLNIAGTPSFQFFNSCTGTSVPSTSSTCPSVQLPTQTFRSFIQQSVLRSGSTLMIGGIDEQDTSQNAEGQGSPFNFLFGGGTSTANTHSLVIICITPQVLDTPSTDQGL